VPRRLPLRPARRPPQSVAACLSHAAPRILSRLGTKSRETIYGASGTLIMPVLLIVIVAVIILIAIMRSASKSKAMLVRQCPYCKNDINGKATVCDYCHRDVTGISS
jgi:glycerol-3-phosphate acyltransferase PlsY